MSEAICTCHCGGPMFYRHLHAESCVLSREGEEAPKSELQTLRDERDRLLHDYHELIMAVETKYPGETRHQTALKYIRRAEESCNIPAQAALTPAGQRWTREKPKEAGWYWYREDGEFLYAVKVRDDLTVIFTGNECEFTMAELGDQEWQGPLTPNEATE